MPKTKQKRIKFSKGEVNPLLSERTDIDILDNSASYIKNYTPTIFGGIKTRLGTKYIDIVRNIINNIENPTITSLIGGNQQDLFNDNVFTSDKILNKQPLFNIKAGNELNSFVRFTINDIYFNKHLDSELTYELEQFEEQNTNSQLSFTLTQQDTYYKLQSINIDVAGKTYLETPIITFSKDDLQPEETLPQAEAIITNGVLTGTTITDAGNLLTDTGLTISITQPTEQTIYYKLKQINIIQAGNNYKTTPLITFSKNDITTLETLPQAEAIINNGILESINITNNGKLLNQDNLILTIEQPQDYNEEIEIKDLENNVLETFTINETPQDITILLSQNYQEVNIIRKNSDVLNTELVLTNFNFNVEKPEITSNIGGDTSNSLNNYESDVIGTTTGELLHFTFNEKVNYFTINGLKLGAGTEAVLRCRIATIKNGPDDYYYRLSSVLIDNAGLGYKNGEQEIQFTVRSEYGAGWLNLPEAKVIIEDYKVKSISITAFGNTMSTEASGLGGDNRLASARLPLMGAEIPLIVKLQAKEDDGTWIDIQQVEINDNEETNINGIIDTKGYKEYRLYKDNTDDITKPLLINSITYGNYGSFTKNARLIPFIYDEKYLLVLCAGYISIYKNDVLINNLQAIDITNDILEELKYTQIENKLILTHTKLFPLEITLKDNVWSINKINLINIPYHNFNYEKETVISNVSLTPSAEEGSIRITSNSSFFTEQSVGQIIDGNGGRLKITKYVSNNEIFGYTIIPFYTKEAFTNFKYIDGFEKVWSEERGFPNACLYYQQRLWFGGSRSRPLGLWASRVGQYNDFNNIGNYDNDGINVELSSKDNGDIINLYGNRGLQIFTETGEFVANEGSLTPNSIFITQTSSVGSDIKMNVFDLAGTTIFIDKKGLNLNTFIYNDTVASYNSQAITLLNNTILKQPKGLAVDYNSSFEDGNYIYIVNSDGTMAVGNILLEQSINAFIRFETKDGEIKSVIDLDNDIYILTLRNNYLFIEKIGDYKTDFTQETNIINGVVNNLSNYKNVRIYNDNKDYGSFEVVDGAVDLQDATINDKVNIGVDIECELISNDIAINNQTTNIKTRLTKATITADKETKELTFNNKKYKSKIVYDDAIFNMYSVSNYELKNRFSIKSIFNKINIKSIVLDVNYGGD